MSIVVSTNILAVNPSVVPTKPKPLATEADNNLAAYTSATPQTTDSTPDRPQSEIAQKKPENFKDALYEKITAKNTQQVHEDAKTTQKTANYQPQSRQNADNYVPVGPKIAQNAGTDNEPTANTAVLETEETNINNVNNALNVTATALISDTETAKGPDAAAVILDGKELGVNIDNKELAKQTVALEGQQLSTNTDADKGPTTAAAILSSDVKTAKSPDAAAVILDGKELNVNVDNKEPAKQTVALENEQLSTNTDADKSPTTATAVLSSDAKTAKSQDAAAMISGGKELNVNVDNNGPTGQTVVMEGKQSTAPEAIAEEIPKQQSGSTDPLNSANSILNKDLQTIQTGLPDEQNKMPEGVEQPDNTSTKPENAQTVNTNEHAQMLSQVSPQTGANNDNQSGNALFKEANSAHIKQSTAQNDTIDSKGQLETVNFEQVLLAADEGTVTKIVSDVSGPKAPEQTEVDIDVTKSITEQVQVSIGNSVRLGNSEITVKLHPAQMGKVLIKFEQQGDQITGLLEVDKPQTRFEIQQALPEIIQNLQDSGIQIKRLEVVLSDTSEQQTYKEPSSAGEQQEWSGRQDSAGENNYQDNKSFHEWLTDYDGYDSPTRPQEIYVSGSSINILV